MELELDPASFERVRRLLRHRTGIELAENRQSLVVARLIRRLRALALDHFEPYLDLVEADEAEASLFVSALTTNVTQFFRERHHFELLRRLACGAPRDEPFKVWSSASSTGEEAWSVAMTLAATPNAPPDWRVLATDIDAEVIARGREAVYPVEQAASVPPELRTLGFERNRSGELLRIRDELQARVFFGQLNLLGEWPMRGSFDVILCRNVLIYFSHENRLRLVRRLASRLKPGGVLMLGHSENVAGNHTGLSSIGKTAFQRSPAASARAA